MALSNTKYFYDKLDEYFRENSVKFSIFTDKYIIIVTNNDFVYKFDRKSIKNISIALGIDRNDILLKIKSAIIQELCNKNITDYKNTDWHSIALTNNGEVYCDYNGWKCLVNIKNENEDKTIKSSLNLVDKIIVQISCGHSISLFLSNDGEVYELNENSKREKDLNGEHILSVYKLYNLKDIKMISCGYNDSLALTNNGSVFIRFNNNKFKLLCDKLTIEPLINVKQISCGKRESWLLTDEGALYILRKYERPYDDDTMKYDVTIIATLTKFNQIASHSFYDFHTGLSNQNKFYVFNNYEKDIQISLKEENQCQSFNDIFAKYLQITFEPNIGSIMQFNDDFFRDYYYEKEFVPSDDTIPREGGFGKVFIVNKMYKCFAIKRMEIKILTEIEFQNNKFEEGKTYTILKELENYSIIQELKDDRVVKTFDLWLQNAIPQKSLFVYIQMESCDQSLMDVMKAMKSDIHFKRNDFLTEIGYFFSSQIFIEILEGVSYLHKQTPKLIHRDLKPDNILLKNDIFKGTIIKIADLGLICYHNFGDKHTADDDIPRGYGHYIAPEVRKSLETKYNLNEIKPRKTEYGEKADIYTLGIVMEELFQIDINRSSYNNLGLSEIFVNKYINLEKTCDQMKQHKLIKRPESCEQILTDKELSLWKLNADEFEYDFKTFCEDSYKNECNDYIHNLLLRMLNNIKENKFNFQIIKYYLKSNIPQTKLKLIDGILRNNYMEQNFISNRLIGEGAFGEVFIANHKLDNVNFAIKQIRDEFSSIDDINKALWSFHTKDEQLRYFLLNHNNNNIVKYIDIWMEIDEQSLRGNKRSVIFNNYIQMELCDQTLRYTIEELNKYCMHKEYQILNSLGYFIASQLYIQLLNGVNFLHKKNPPIIHRDLKPDNILISLQNDSHSIVKIADFSISCFHDFFGQPQFDVGTLSYVAPEVLVPRIYNTKADIYSLGVIANELFLIDQNIELISTPFTKYHELFRIDRDIELISTPFTKYDELFKWSDQMTMDRYRERPDCDDMLKSSHLWSISKDEYDRNSLEYIQNSNDANERNCYIVKLLNKILE